MRRTPMTRPLRRRLVNATLSCRVGDAIERSAHSRFPSLGRREAPMRRACPEEAPIAGESVRGPETAGHTPTPCQSGGRPNERERTRAGPPWSIVQRHLSRASHASRPLTISVGAPTLAAEVGPERLRSGPGVPVPTHRQVAGASGIPLLPTARHCGLNLREPAPATRDVDASHARGHGTRRHSGVLAGASRGPRTRSGRTQRYSAVLSGTRRAQLSIRRPRVRVPSLPSPKAPQSRGPRVRCRRAIAEPR